MQSVSQAFRTYVAAQCDATALPGLDNLAIGSLATMNLTRNVVLPTKSPDGAGADAQHCMQKNFSYTPPPTASAFFNCYQINMAQAAAAKADKSTFAASKTAFIEVLVHVRDLRDDSLVACKDILAASGGQGLEIYYSLHWMLNSNNGLIYKTKVGTINVAL